MKRTIVFGASPNPERYSYLATEKLQKFGHETIPVGIRKGKIAHTDIQLGQPIIENVDTITLYMNPKRQKPFYDYILGLNPNRIIFNPGTENQELLNLAQKKGIKTTVACTLVMLSVGDY